MLWSLKPLRHTKSDSLCGLWEVSVVTCHNRPTQGAPSCYATVRVAVQCGLLCFVNPEAKMDFVFLLLVTGHVTRYVRAALALRITHASVFLSQPVCGPFVTLGLQSGFSEER